MPSEIMQHEVLTEDEARERNVSGWNIRCNLCGSYGAIWVPGQRSGWGSLCLCPTHRGELEAELHRHDAEMARLRTINFEQRVP